MIEPIARLRLPGSTHLRHLLAFTLLCGLWMGNAPPGGDVRAAPLWPEEEQRFRVGLKLFPACLGGVQWPKGNGEAEDLSVLVVHEGAPSLARKAAATLAAIGEIRGRKLKIEPVSASDIRDFRGGDPHAIFVASPGFDGAHLRNWSERFGALVFSPFAGEVENGAVAGMFVADRILPFVNLKQARRAGIRFKPFFLLVAKQHG